MRNKKSFLCNATHNEKQNIKRNLFEHLVVKQKDGRKDDPFLFLIE